MEKLAQIPIWHVPKTNSASPLESAAPLESPPEIRHSCTSVSYLSLANRVKRPQSSEAEEIVKLLGPWPLIRRPEAGKEQAVIVSMRLSNDHFGNEIEDASLGKLEVELERSLDGTKAGEW